MKLNTLAFTTLVALATLTSSPFAVDHKAGLKEMKQVKMAQSMMVTTSMFKGIEVNGGSATFAYENGKPTLSLSSDFMIPKSPAPSWQVVDAKGNTYLLNQLRIAGDKTNLKIVLPSTITSISKVQIWCSFAEVNLGEAQFAKPIKIKK